MISQVAQIEQHIAKSRGAVKSLQPQIDFSTFSSFQAKEKIITQLENKRKAILRECYNDAKHKRLRKKLKENLDQVAKDLAKYSKDHQGFFVSSKEEANITCQNLSTNQRLLEHSPLFEVDKEKSTQLGQNLIETISKIEKRKNKLDKLKNVVTARVAEKISQSGQVKMAEDIFESLRKELIFTSNVSEIAPLPTKNIINKRKALDRAWAELTCTPDTIVLMEKASTESLDPRIRLRLTALMEKYKESQAKIQIEESQVVVIQPEPVGDLLKNEESNPLLPLFPSELSLEVEPQEKQSLKVEKPLKKPGILEIIYNALKTFYSVIKEFFSKLISCFSCGRSDEKNLDEDSPPPPIVDNEKGESRILPSSTATLPFPIGTHVKQSDQITTDNLNHVIISNPSLPLSPKPPR